MHVFFSSVIHIIKQSVQQTLTTERAGHSRKINATLFPTLSGLFLSEILLEQSHQHYQRGLTPLTQTIHLSALSKQYSAARICKGFFPTGY